MNDLCVTISILIICLSSAYFFFAKFLNFLERRDQGLGDRNYSILAAILLLHGLILVTFIADGFENDAIITLWGGFLGFVFAISQQKSCNCRKEEKKKKDFKK